MADAGLFIGWGAPVRGREQVGLTVFNDAIHYYGARQESGAIESFETVLLDPHGGDLYGFFLVRGSQDQVDALRNEDEFQKLHTRAGLIVDRLGVVSVALGEGLGTAIGIYADAVSELAPQ